MTGEDLVDPAGAQGPPDIPLPDAGPQTGVQILAGPTDAYQRLSENGRAQFPVRIIDISLEASFVYTTPIQTTCRVENQTEDTRAWGVAMPSGPSIGRNEERTININIMAGMAASPRIFQVEVSCHAANPLNREIGRFTLTAELETYQRFAVSSVGVPPRAGPGDMVQLQAEVQNSGNEATRYLGSVEAPEGWVFSTPPPVVLDPGESRTVDVQGYAPRDKIWYRPSSSSIVVSYWPEEEPGRAQSQFFPVNLQGLYLHPALIPLVLLSLLAVTFLVLLGAYARRSVEEQVLGKPIPPWRIPVERDHLSRLENDDPDEFYIVRYHLMVEEHQSALLWYKHYKHATRKDRKKERAWLKKKQKVGGKTTRLENRHERMKSFVAWRLRRLPRRRRRRLTRFDKKLHHEQWREQRRLLKIHGRSIKRIDAIHRKRSKQLEKEHKSGFEREEKRIARENRKRFKRGEDPLPVPEETELQTTDPEFPELVEVPLSSVVESRFAVRAERKNARFNRRIARRTRRVQKKLGRKRRRLEQKTERLESKVPSEPVGDLYRDDEFVSDDEVVVEDGRPMVQKALRIPSMETRHALNRRRSVYRSKIAQAKNEHDMERVERLKREYAAERARIMAAGAAPELDGDLEQSGGGPLRLLTRKRKGGQKEGKEAGDAANQAPKEDGASPQQDGSDKGDRSLEE